MWIFFYRMSDVGAGFVLVTFITRTETDSLFVRRSIPKNRN
jgi:hypothetical protein